MIDDSLVEPSAPEPSAPEPSAVPGVAPESPAGPHRGSRGLTIAFIVALGLLALLGTGGVAAGAVDALLANPAESCGGG